MAALTSQSQQPMRILIGTFNHDDALWEGYIHIVNEELVVPEPVSMSLPDLLIKIPLKKPRMILVCVHAKSIPNRTRKIKITT